MAVNGVHPRAAVAVADTNLAAATAAAKVVDRAVMAVVKKVARVVASNGKHTDEVSSAGLVQLV